MGDKQWLQAVVPIAEWESINTRRAKLNLKWADLLLPAAKAELDRLEADAAPAPTAKGKGKKAPTTKGKKTTDSKENKAQSGEEKAPAEEVK